jgi:type IV pilus assembly protein PilE
MKQQQGFTLIEVMITVAIIAILAAIAIPNYQEYIKQGRRSDARAMLLQVAQWMEKYRSENNGSYANAALPTGFSKSPDTGEKMYDITLTNLAAGAYTLNAVPTGLMAQDECGTFTLDNTGLKTAGKGSTDEAVLKKCWGR